MESELDDLMECAILGLISDSDMDCALEYYLLSKSKSKPRRLKFDKNKFNLETMEDEEVLKNFRFKKEDIPRLVAVLGIPEFVNLGDRIKVSGITAFCMLTRRLAYPNKLADLAKMFGCSTFVLTKVTNILINIIEEKYGHLLEDLQSLKWLDEVKLNEYSSAVKTKGAPLQNCWGFIDGTVRRICCPIRDQGLYWNAIKNFHCVKYQSILSPDGLIVSLHGEFTGCRHDVGLFRVSKIEGQLKKLGPPNFVIYGPSTYVTTDFIRVPPYKGRKWSQEETHFHCSMSKIRQAVECGFDKVVTEFALFDFNKNKKLLHEAVTDMYKAATLLTNCHTCLYGSQTSEYFSVKPPELEVYLQ